MRVLIVDNSKSNRDYLKYIIKHWFAETEEIDSLILEEASTVEGTLHKIRSNSFDYLFLSKIIEDSKCFHLIEKIRAQELLQQPSIYVTITSHDQTLEDTLISVGANGYIKKPIAYNIIGGILSGFLQNLQDAQNDDFFDFDEFDEFDENEDSEDIESFCILEDIRLDKNMLEEFNNTHHNVSASEFFKDKPNLNHLEKEFVVIIESIDEFLINAFDEDIFNRFESVQDILSKFLKTLTFFPEFIELNTSIRIFIKLLDRIERDPIINKAIANGNNIQLSTYITGIIDDLKTWIENVFVKKEVKDIFYINASSLNNCIELEYFMKKCIKENR